MCCSLLEWMRLVRILRYSGTSAQQCIDLNHHKQTDSVDPRPVVGPPLLFKDDINTCLMMRSDHNPVE